MMPSCRQLPSMTLTALFFTLMILHEIDASAPLDCRIFPFHPMCRGLHFGKRSSSLVPILDSELGGSSSSANDAAINRQQQLLSDFRKFTYATVCRGTTSKRAARVAEPTVQSYATSKLFQNDKAGEMLGTNEDRSQHQKEAKDTLEAPRRQTTSQQVGSKTKRSSDSLQSFSSFYLPGESKRRRTNDDPDDIEFHRRSDSSIPSSFSSFVKRAGEAENSLPPSFSSFLKRSNGDLPSSFSAFLKRSTEDLFPTSFSSFIKRSTEDLPPSSFSSFYKRVPDSELPNSFSAFLKRSPVEIPGTFSSFYKEGKRGDFPQTFSSFYVTKRLTPNLYNLVGRGRSSSASSDAASTHSAGKRNKSPYNTYVRTVKSDPDVLPLPFTAFYTKRSKAASSEQDQVERGDVDDYYSKRESLPLSGFSSFYLPKRSDELNSFSSFYGKRSDDLNSFSSFYGKRSEDDVDGDDGSNSVALKPKGKRSSSGDDVLSSFSSFYYPEKKYAEVVGRPQSKKDSDGSDSSRYFMPFV